MLLHRLLLRRHLRAAALAHLGGVGVLALVVLVEAGDRGGLAALLTQLPPLWARAAAPLALVAAARCTTRARRDGVVLALGSFGVSPLAWLFAGAAVGALAGGAAALVPPPLAPASLRWVRGDGGWFLDGRPIPDHPGGVVLHLLPETLPAWAPPAVAAGAATLGAALGLKAGALTMLTATGTLLVAGALAEGLVERGVLQPLALGLLALGLTFGGMLVARAGRAFPRRR